jgi:cytochrome c553
VFETKRCGACHVAGRRQDGAPALEELRRPQGAFELAGRLWNHVPAMFALLASEGLAWPEITLTEMAGLLAYLGGDTRRDPAPEPVKGQVALLRKGCLKCHSLRGEGGRIAPDLAGRRAAYESPAAWAATMWVHTPRMAARAAEVGVLYPRFAGEEMGNLVGFLRSAAR